MRFVVPAVVAVTITVVQLSAPSTSHAGEVDDAAALDRGKPPHHCSAHLHGGKTRLVALTDAVTGACTGFEVLDAAGRTIIVHQGALDGSGRLVSSDDGRRVVFVADLPRAKLFADGTLRPRPLPPAYRRGQGQAQAAQVVGDKTEQAGATLDVEALALFFDGKKVASYSLHDLVARPFLVDLQGEQVRWLSGDVGFLSAPVGKVLELTTTSFRKLAFDTETGRLLRAGDTAAWNSCDALVYGNLSALGNGRCGAKPYWVIHGKVPQRLNFELADALEFRNGYQTACLKWTDGGASGQQGVKRLQAVELFGPLGGVALRP